MNRREVLEKFVQSLFLLPNISKTKEIKLLYKSTTLKVAGLQYGECVDEEFIPGKPLILTREPQNQYDTYAIAIYKEAKKVGYIPKTYSRIIASMLDNGEKIYTKVRYYKAEEEP
ncbi:MAG TPA: hypothetical protein ENK87_02105 [Nitratifractor sp.]|nr:hypothetical protein [Nitratifractor sp.]